MIRFSCEPFLLAPVRRISRLVPAASAMAPVDIEFIAGDPGFLVTLTHDLRSTVTIRASHADGYPLLLRRLHDALKMLPAAAGTAPAIACIGTELGRAHATTRKLAIVRHAIA